MSKCVWRTGASNCLKLARHGMLLQVHTHTMGKTANIGTTGEMILPFATVIVPQQVA